MSLPELCARAMIPVCLATLVVAISGPVAAQDECGDAVDAVEGSNPFDLTMATSSSDPFDNGECNIPGQGEMDFDVWFRWIAPADGVLTATTCNPETAIASMIAVYTGSCGSLDQIQCNNLDVTEEALLCGLGRSTVSLFVNVGVQYYFRVGEGFPTFLPGTGSLDLSLDAGSLLANDECGGALPVSAPATLSFDSSFTTTSADAFDSRGCGLVDGIGTAGDPTITRDQWFAWTAPSDGSLEVSTCNAATLYDTQLVVYSGTCGDKAEAPCTSPSAAEPCGFASGLQAIVVVPVTVGTQYLIRIGTNHESSPWTGDLDLIFIPDDVPFRRGDSNLDNSFDLGDAIFLLGALFGTDILGCEDAGDANDDGSLDIGDAITILSALFSGGLLPPTPGPFDCGVDPTDDTLACAVPADCP